MKTKLFIISLSILISFNACKEKNETKPVIQDVKELVFASGELQWDDAYNLTAQTDGILLDANFDIGNTITKGQVLAKIDNRTNINNTETASEQLTIANENLTSNSPALQQLQQNIQFAESKYLQDKTQVERYERLYEKQSIAKVELENVQLQAKNSMSQLNALKKQAQQILQQAKQQQINSQNQVKNNKVMQQYNLVVAPQRGTIIKKIKSSGDYVRKGDVIANIANQDNVEIILNVDESSIGKIKLGQPVYIQLNSDKNKIYNGVVSEILAAFDNQTQSFICKAKVDEPFNNALFGTQLEANILIGEKKNALLIPRKMVGFGNKISVKGKKDYVIIKPGIVSTEYVEVLEGVSKDDVILPIK